MILVTKNGWLIAGEVVKETKQTFTFQPVDSSRPTIIPKDSTNRKLFEDVKEAMKWIEEGE
ncbi:hypothetical protein KLEP7_gp54 [Pseudaeromonas phage vB_PpeM_ KLEP7]|nr:hypothetical protein KLEP7_gp54 [Pseudaeromonas phage vB_PpeM_ KLEP7]